MKIKDTNTSDKDTVKVIQEELKLIPEEHRAIIKDTAKEINIVSEGNSRYDRKKGIVYILKNPTKGEIIHELGHVIETKLDLYHDNEFMKILNSGLENINLLNLEEDHNYPNSIWKLTAIDKFISDYQSRLYDNDIDGNPRIDYANMTINTKTLGEYFSEGYNEYIKNPDNLKHKDESLYNFIKGRFGYVDIKLGKKLLETSAFEEFKRVAISNNVTRFEDFSIKTLKHMESLMPKNDETSENHGDPREAFTNDCDEIGGE